MMMAAPPRRPTRRRSCATFVYAEPKPGTIFLWESWLRHEVVARHAARASGSASASTIAEPDQRCEAIEPIALLIVSGTSSLRASAMAANASARRQARTRRARHPRSRAAATNPCPAVNRDALPAPAQARKCAPPLSVLRSAWTARRDRKSERNEIQIPWREHERRLRLEAEVADFLTFKQTKTSSTSSARQAAISSSSHSPARGRAMIPRRWPAGWRIHAIEDFTDQGKVCEPGDHLLLEADAGARPAMVGGDVDGLDAALGVGCSCRDEAVGLLRRGRRRR